MPTAPGGKHHQTIIRLVRSQLGQPWASAETYIRTHWPSEVDPALLAQYVAVDPHLSPGTHGYGEGPRFYTHRTSRRLLEYYPTK